MQIDFEKLMAGKSDEGLQEYIDDRAKYKQEAFDAAINEMTKRGRVFTAEELDKYKEEFKIRQELEDAAIKEEDRLLNPEKDFDTNIVEDVTAPELFSQGGIYGLSTISGPLIGAIMLAANFKRVKAEKGIPIVILFGILYSGLVFYCITHLNSIASSDLFKTPRALIKAPVYLNILGALVLNMYFWRKYIGKDKKYRARPMLIPIVISLILAAAIVFAIVSQNH